MSEHHDLPAPSIQNAEDVVNTDFDLSQIPPDALDSAGRVDCELPCRQCGYNLRTMEANANCPECGTAIPISLVPDLLRFADADWLDSIARGIAWLLITFLISFILGIIVAISSATIGAGTPAFEFVGLGIVLLATLATIYGYLLMTTPEPQPGITPSVGVRSWARGLLIGSAVFNMAAAVLAVVLGLNFNSTSPSSSSIIIMESFDTLSTLLGVAGMFCLAVVLRRLALRAPAPGIARDTTIQIWGWAILMTFSLVGGVLVVMAGLSSSPGGSSTGITLPVVFGCSIVLIALAFVIWLLILLIRYRNLLKRHAGYARFRVPEQRLKPLV